MKFDDKLIKKWTRWRLQVEQLSTDGLSSGGGRQQTSFGLFEPVGHFRR